MPINKLIVIVDDDSGLTDTVSQVMTEEGYRTQTFNSGKNFVNNLPAIAPDLILLDVRLPDISGDRIAKIIRQNPAYKKTPIILVSANANLNNLCPKCLADGYLEKPFDFDRLLTMVTYYLNRTV